MKIAELISSEIGTNRFYVVWAGHQVGIFVTWEEAEKRVTGFPNCGHRSISGIQQAIWLLKVELEARSLEKNLSPQERETLNDCIRHYKLEVDSDFPGLL